VKPPNGLSPTIVGCLRGTAPETHRQARNTKNQLTPTGSPWPTGHRFADRTRANQAAIHTLLAAGHSRRAIQRQLGMTYRTVKLLADATTPEARSLRSSPSDKASGYPSGSTQSVRTTCPASTPSVLLAP
jgi:hypothetical protein